MIQAVNLPQLMVVEDSSDDEMMTLRGISESLIPCVVQVCRSGEDAIDYLFDGNTLPPSLIVLDYELPQKNGSSILRELRSHLKTRFIPVVIFTGRNDESIFSECYRLGANSCVVKPVDSIQYFERLVLLTKYWLTVNEQVLCTN